MRRPAFLILPLLLASCSRYPKSPEAAYRRLTEVLRAHDAVALWSAVDQPTRWCWMTVQRRHREAHDIILSSYPEGATRDRELRRFEKAAASASAAELFAAEVGAAALSSGIL